MTHRGRKGEALLLAALAAGRDVREAAHHAGVSERTCYRRLTDPAFRRKVDETRQQMLDRAVGTLSYASVAAVQTMATLLKANSETVRLGAARAILEMGCKLREIEELAKRIERLEELQGNSNVIDAKPALNGQLTRRKFG